MPHPPAAFLLLASATALGPAARDTVLDGVQLAQMTIHERIIIRVPRNAAPAPSIRWVEKKGPKCVAADQLGGAIVGTRTVDLVLRVIDQCTSLFPFSFSFFFLFSFFFFFFRQSLSFIFHISSPFPQYPPKSFLGW